MIGFDLRVEVTVVKTGYLGAPWKGGVHHRNAGRHRAKGLAAVWEE
jgi:hypothetical protein